MTEKPAIGIFGAGWVGLVTGACFADLGHRVVVRDVIEDRIEMLNAGRLPFHEADLPEVIERNRERLTFTLDAEELTSATDLFFACVDTPADSVGRRRPLVRLVGDRRHRQPGRRAPRHEEHGAGGHRGANPRAISTSGGSSTSGTSRTPSSSPRAVPSGTS